MIQDLIFILIGIGLFVLGAFYGRQKERGSRVSTPLFFPYNQVIEDSNSTLNLKPEPSSLTYGDPIVFDRDEAEIERLENNGKKERIDLKDFLPKE